jgi:hypothetical protein
LPDARLLFILLLPVLLLLILLLPVLLLFILLLPVLLLRVLLARRVNAFQVINLQGGILYKESCQLFSFFLQLAVFLPSHR